MTEVQPPPVAHAGSPSRLPRVTAWTLGLMAAVQFLQWTFVQPADVQVLLGFQRGDLESGRWWTALTFPLAHQDTALLLLNASVFALFGSRLERSWGGRQFAAFAIVSGLAGWTLHLLSGSSGALLGASSAAFAVLAAYAMQWGTEEQDLAGGLRMRVPWITVIMASMILLIGLRTSAGGLGFLAHLGGIGAAWLFVRATPVLLVERLRDGVSSLPDEPPDDMPPRVVPRSPPRSRARDREAGDDAVSRASVSPTRRTAPLRQADPGPQPSAPPPSIDTILDKISAEGLERLTEEERRVLDDHSRRLRDH